MLAACEAEDECTTDEDCAAEAVLSGIPNTKCFVVDDTHSDYVGSIEHGNYRGCFATVESRQIRDTCTEVDPTMECVSVEGLVNKTCAKKK